MSSDHALLEAYLDQLEKRSYASATIETVRRWVGRFQRFCRERAGLAGLAGTTAAHVQAFQQALRWELGPHERLYSAHTVATALERLRMFFRWAWQRGLLLVDPFEGIVLRAVRTERRCLTEAEVERLLRAPDVLTPRGLRDRTILETLYGTGIRREECHALDLADLDLEQLVLTVRRGKGGVPRRQPMGLHLADILRRYLVEGRPLLARNPAERALFIGNRGARLHKASIGALVRRHAHFAGLGRVTPHLLRHACASHMVARDADLVDVQRLLGHRALDSTRAYVHVHPDQVAREHRRTHPRARRKKP